MEKIIVCLTGVVNRSIKHTWASIKDNIIDELEKEYEVKNYLKDHRIFMMSTVAALTLGGNWKIHDPDSIQSSFPTFLKKIKKLGGKLK